MIAYDTTSAVKSHSISAYKVQVYDFTRAASKSMHPSSKAIIQLIQPRNLIAKMLPSRRRQ